LASSLADEVTKTGVVPMRDLVQHVLSQLQVSLRAGEADMAHVGRERGQEGPEICPLPVPERQPKDRKGVPQIVEAYRSSAAAVSYSSVDEYLAKGAA
jgi:hypothetical protein